MFAPMVNPYDPCMAKVERRGTWDKWTRRRKFMYFLALRFPSFLSYFYRRSFLSGKHDQIDKWLSLSLGKRVRIFFFFFFTHDCFQMMYLQIRPHYHLYFVMSSNGCYGFSLSFSSSSVLFPVRCFYNFS
jgi:hypothetical protein